CQQGYTYPYSF
nr:immunoglobulin light chain junction region [Macaca mulatta]MPN81562.1 immunoglobulin light chain junction region [Macaca mulatta]MPN81564.1 immunoglobulin light chain junction region [Macaca mulatta]MPN81577.1 immunoglobulin light chain junction region [Macaca mulatta]MPN81597.1 immunoglobulin light chain junction region [Macaca mulatta]